MAKKKKFKSKTMPKSKRAWLEPRLRRISLYWPGKVIARDQAKVRVQIGKYKNGKPEFRVFYRCNECKALFLEEETQMDHINPVVKLTGYNTVDEYIERLLANPEGYQCLCISCHAGKTLQENIIRDKLKK